jgi:hypothetical protein
MSYRRTLKVSSENLAANQGEGRRCEERPWPAGRIGPGRGGVTARAAGPVGYLLVRTFISLPAGFAAMPAGRFGLYTTLGCIPWTAALGIAGYALGANWQSVANGFQGPTYAIAGIVVIALAVALIMYVRRNRSTA